MESPVIVISLALAIINVVCVWFINKDFFEEITKKIIIIGLVIFDVLDIIAITNLLK